MAFQSKGSVDFYRSSFVLTDVTVLKTDLISVGNKSGLPKIVIDPSIFGSEVGACFSPTKFYLYLYLMLAESKQKGPVSIRVELMARYLRIYASTCERALDEMFGVGLLEGIFKESCPMD